MFCHITFQQNSKFEDNGIAMAIRGTAGMKNRGVFFSESLTGVAHLCWQGEIAQGTD